MVMQYCLDSPAVSVSGWFDREYAMYNMQGISVDDPEAALGADFDVMVIAILNTTIAGQVRDWYVHLDMEAERIDCVSLDVLERSGLPFGMERG